MKVRPIDLGRAETLSQDAILCTGFGSVELTIETPEGLVVTCDYERTAPDAVMTLADLERDFGVLLKRSRRSTLVFEAPLSGRTYEYNVLDGKWYLIKTGRGFA